VSIYTYPQGSVLDKVSIVRTEGGGVRAYLHAADGIDPQTLEKISQNLEPLGWQGTAIRMEGKDYFEVRGFEKEENLLDYLKKNQFVLGSPEVVKDKKRSYLEKIKNNKLFMCGILNTIADIGYYVYGWLDYFDPNHKKLETGKSKWENIAAGFSYSAGSLVLLGFGHADKSDMQLKDISSKLLKFAIREGIEVHDKSAVESFAVDHKKGITDNISDTFHRYPSEIFNILTAMAGVFITTSAVRHNEYPNDPQKNKRHKILESILGVSTASSGFLAAFVKEKAHDPSKPKAHGLAAVAQYFQEKPNRIAGYGYMISSGAHAINTIMDFREAQKNKNGFGMLRHSFRGLFVTLNLAAEVILSLSSKGHGDGVKSDPSVDKTTYAMVADIIARQPESMREHLITDFSTNFLAHPDVLGGDPKVIASAIREQVAASLSNPWANARKESSNVGKNWQSKVMAPAASIAGASPMTP
jgi:hypothetical protein